MRIVLDNLRHSPKHRIGGVHLDKLKVGIRRELPQEVHEQVETTLPKGKNGKITRDQFEDFMMGLQ